MLSVHYVTGTNLGDGDTEVNKMDKIPAFMWQGFYCKRWPTNKSTCHYMIQSQVSAPK